MNKLSFISLAIILFSFGLLFPKDTFAANFIINYLHYNGGTSYTISTPCCIHFPEYNSGVYKTNDNSLFSSFSSYSGIGDTWVINDLPKIPEGVYYFIIKGDRSQDLTIDSNGNAVTPTPSPTNEPTPIPTNTPTSTPTQEPTPTNMPSPTPTQEPTPTPTVAPTEEPTPTPTEEPLATPTLMPTNTPTPTPIVPITKEECKKGLWQFFINLFFKNQGSCVKSVVN